MRKHNEQHTDPWDRDRYETGSTRPPKQKGGVIAVLLTLVILLGGLCSALGIVNFRLLQQIAQGEEQHKTLELFEDSRATDPSATITAGKDRLPRLGITGQTVSEFDRRYYELPKGILVTDAAEKHCGYKAGIRVGDVIFALNGREIATQEALSEELSRFTPGQQIKLEVYRSQTRQRFSTTVTLLEED